MTCTSSYGRDVYGDEVDLLIKKVEDVRVRAEPLKTLDYNFTIEGEDWFRPPIKTIAVGKGEVGEKLYFDNASSVFYLRNNRLRHRDSGLAVGHLQVDGPNNRKYAGLLERWDADWARLQAQPCLRPDDDKEWCLFSKGRHACLPYQTCC